jgi:hypothetical protein
MTSLEGCAGGGWTMVMKIDGSEVLPLSSIYIWSENTNPKSESSFVLTAQTKTIERDWN